MIESNRKEKPMKESTDKLETPEQVFDNILTNCWSLERFKEWVSDREGEAFIRGCDGTQYAYSMGYLDKD